MDVRKALALAGAALADVLALGAQTTSDDEIRWSTRPYAPPAAPTLRVQTNLVLVPVVVRDAHDRPVGDLKQGDFELLDDGKPQAISSFTVENAAVGVSAGAAPPAGKDPAPPLEPAAPPPLRYVALLFDDMNLSPVDLSPVQKAAEKMFGRGLQAGDRVGVFTTSGKVMLEPSNDLARIVAAIREISSHQREPIPPGSCPHMNLYQAHLIYDRGDAAATDLSVMDGIAQGCLRGNPAPAESVRAAASSALTLADHLSQETMERISEVIRYLGKLPGRKTLVLTSSGFFTMNLGAKQDTLMNLALKANVVMNSLDAKGLYAETPGDALGLGPDMILRQRRMGSQRPSTALTGDVNTYADSLARLQRESLKDPLAVLAVGTGGRFFHDNNNFTRGMQELASATEATYVLGFSPAEMIADGKFHALKVSLASKKPYSVEARKGYFAPTNQELTEPSAPDARTDKLHHAVLGSETPSEIPGELSTQLVKTAGGKTALEVTLHVEVKDLPFLRRDDRSLERLVIIVALLDANGHFRTGTEKAADLSLKDATRALLAKQGLDTKFSMQAPPGSYRLRVVVEEMGGGRMSALSQPVEIR